MGLCLLCIRMVDWLIFDKCCGIIGHKKSRQVSFQPIPFPGGVKRTVCLPHAQKRPCVFLLSTADPVHGVPGLLHKKAAPSRRNPAKMEVTLDRSAFAFTAKGYFMEFLVSNINGYLTFYCLSPVLYDFRFCHVGLCSQFISTEDVPVCCEGGIYLCIGITSL